jgi:5-methylcytosine-specific restriction protein A
MPSRPRTHRPVGASSSKRADAPRLSAHKRGYTAAWRRVSKAHLDRNPLCVECLKDGATVPATDVDHIIPHRGDPVLFWDENNWQSLCASHHSAKTGRGE